MGYILVVEDNQSTADMIIRLLQTEGYTVQHTLKGLDGARMARKERPDLILMDFNLPDVDGRSMVLMLKKQLGGDKAAPPIIAVTAKTGQAEEYVARRFGCDAFISKPFNPQEFVTVIKSFTSERVNR